MKVGRASGEPVLAEVGPPFMLSLDVAGYCSVMRPWPRGTERARAVRSDHPLPASYVEAVLVGEVA
jgi:hypothetical protein